MKKTCFRFTYSKNKGADQLQEMFRSNLMGFHDKFGQSEPILRAYLARGILMMRLAITGSHVHLDFSRI